jgi:hypothetical protein
MRLNHFVSLTSFRGALATCVLGSLLALPQLAAAEAPSGGVMKQRRRDQRQDGSSQRRLCLSRKK